MWIVKSLLLSVVLLCFLVSCTYAADYLMNATTQQECLLLIQSLENDLAMLISQLRQLEINLTETEKQSMHLKITVEDLNQQIKNLNESLKKKEQSLLEWEMAYEIVRKNLKDLEKSLKICQKQIRWLRIERWFWLAGGILLGAL